MVIDATEADFATAVIERSRTTPVVVDFWAEWCGPCRSLGPLLEQAAADREGQVVLAKVDLDSNQALAAQHRVQGIPAVKAFRDGAVVSEFVGAKPRAEVERFFDALVPSETDKLVAAGDEASLRRAVELEPARADAAVPLARLLLSRGERDGVEALLANVPGSFAADGLRARLQLETSEDGFASSLSAAWRALDDGEREVALDTLIAALPHSDGSRDLVRQVVIGILDELGADSPVARDYRRRLATALY